MDQAVSIRTMDAQRLQAYCSLSEAKMGLARCNNRFGETFSKAGLESPEIGEPSAVANLTLNLTVKGVDRPRFKLGERGAFDPCQVVRFSGPAGVSRRGGIAQSWGSGS